MLATLALALPLAACSADDGAEPTVTATPVRPDADVSPSDTPDTPDNPPSPAGRPTVSDTIADGLAVPWGLGFLPSGDAIVTERDTTRLLLVAADTREVSEVGRIGASPNVEGGLLGVAVSPTFDDDRLLFFYFTSATDNRIVRATFDGRALGTPEVVLDGIPSGAIHDGGRLAFGPDGFLYAATGETGVGELAQDLDSLGGKILRITTEGGPAPGNPFAGSPVWSYGHRNVQGLAFDDAGRLWASEFGQSDFDELNLIRKGGNYGWPYVEGRGGNPDYVEPQVVWDTDDASPSGLAWHDGRLWLGALRGERLWRVDVRGARAGNPRDFFVGDYGRLRSVAAAPDGTLWLTTSNRDGRGAPAPRDDRILQVTTR